MRWFPLFLVLLAFWPSPVVGLTPHQEARAILDRWLEAQNQGRFTEYQMYYGDEFTGVRRSGNRTVSFDRKGWMQDRQRMFEKPMTVAADRVHIFASVQTARIVFTQRWSSGHYTDTGPKQLILRRGPDGFHIAREELFASDQRQPGTIDLDAFRRLAFIVDGEVVVSTEADDAWAAGRPILEKPGRDPLLQRSRRAIDKDKLPPGVVGLVGTAVSLMDARGIRCPAKLGELFLRGRVFEDPGSQGPPGSPEPPETDGTEVWGISPHYLVARVVGDRTACAGATWARAAALPMPAIATAQPPSPETKKRALAAFKALPESATIQREYAQWYAGEHPGGGHGTPSWFGRTRQPPVIRIFRPASGPALLSVSAMVAEGGCENGVLDGLWALWEMDDQDPAHPRLVLRNQPDPDLTLQPTAAVDIDGDGTPELLFDSAADYASTNASGQPDFREHGIVRMLAGSYVGIEAPETPIYVCPC
jgi:hypothetical protein